MTTSMRSAIAHIWVSVVLRLRWMAPGHTRRANNMEEELCGAKMEGGLCRGNTERDRAKHRARSVHSKHGGAEQARARIGVQCKDGVEPV
eukprot:546263-Rhodomonas_salina.14